MAPSGPVNALRRGRIGPPVPPLALVVVLLTEPAVAIGLDLPPWGEPRDCPPIVEPFNYWDYATYVLAYGAADADDPAWAADCLGGLLNYCVNGSAGAEVGDPGRLTAEELVRLAEGGGWDPFVAWTPLLVINSPYRGSAAAETSTTYSTSFKLGERWVTIDAGSSASRTTSISATNGNSYAYYMKIQWKHVLTYSDICFGGEGHWEPADYTPRGYPEFRTKALTGPSRTTDADNLEQASFTASELAGGVKVMRVKARFKDVDKVFCGDDGSSTTWTWGSDQWTKIGVSVPLEGEDILGVMKVRVESKKFTYTFPGGHCWEADRLGGGRGLAFNYQGTYNADLGDPSEAVNPDL